MASFRSWTRIVMLLPLVAAVLVALWGYMDATGGVGAQTVWNETWPGTTGGIRGGYLVTPAQARRIVPVNETSPRPEASPDGRRPAVLFIHTGEGLSVETARLAELLAADGYVVLAPDLFRGNRAISLPGVFVLRWLNSAGKVAEDLDLAFRQLGARRDVDPRRIAVLGISYGGTQAILAGTRSDAPALIASISGAPAGTEADDLGSLRRRVPFFGAYGRNDTAVSPDEIRRFADLLREYHGVVTVRWYDGIGRDFLSVPAIRAGGTPALVWRDLRGFLAAHL